MKQTTKRPKMVRELYEEFVAKFSPNEIAATPGLTTLFQYLQRQMERSGMKGNYVHVPSDYMQDLLEKHLEYRYVEEMRTK